MLNLEVLILKWFSGFLICSRHRQDNEDNLAKTELSNIEQEDAAVPHARLDTP